MACGINGFNEEVCLTYVAGIQFTFLSVFRRFFHFTSWGVRFRIQSLLVFFFRVRTFRIQQNIRNTFIVLVIGNNIQLKGDSIRGNEGKHISELDRVSNYSFAFPLHRICDTSKSVITTHCPILVYHTKIKRTRYYYGQKSALQLSPWEFCAFNVRKQVNMSWKIRTVMPKPSN